MPYSSSSQSPPFNFLPTHIPSAVSSAAPINHPSNQASTRLGSKGAPRASEITLPTSFGRLLRSNSALEITYVAHTWLTANAKLAWKADSRLGNALARSKNVCRAELKERSNMMPERRNEICRLQAARSRFESQCNVSIERM